MTSDTEESDSDLHVAVRYGDLEEVREALSSKLSPNQIGLYQWSPLHEASSNGHTEIVRLLLQHGGNPNMTDHLDGNTSVHYAAREGHSSCLSLLMDHGGDYSKMNHHGESAKDMATATCKRIIEKARVAALLRMSLEKAKEDAIENTREIDRSQTSSNPDDKISQTSGSISDSVWSLEIIDQSKGRTRAWSSRPQMDIGAMGQLQLSFEYNKKKASFKIRLWKLSGLMVDPENSSMLSTIYVKSSLVPDVNRKTKRKSEEVKIATELTANGGKKQQQPYITDGDIEVIYKPVSFKFSRPLIYEEITPETVREKVILIQVCVKQKFTQRSYVLGDLTIPFNVAVTKLIRESYTIRTAIQTRLPDNMVILPEIKAHWITSSDPNLRQDSLFTSGGKLRPASDSNLRDIRSLSSQSPSVSIDILSDEEVEIENGIISGVSDQQIPVITVHRDSPNVDPSVICIPGFIDEEDEAESIELKSIYIKKPPDSQYQLVYITDDSEITHSTQETSDVRIAMTNTDSDDPGPKEKPESKIHKLIRRINPNTRDKVVLLEAQCTNRWEPITSISYAQEKNVVKLHKPKSSPTEPSACMVRQSSSDVMISIGDLELKDIDDVPGVHVTARCDDQSV